MLPVRALVMGVTLRDGAGRDIECSVSKLSAAVRRRSDLPPESSLEPIRLLIAEDDENFGMWLSAVARRLGLDVATAVDGAEAFDLLRSGDFDMLISDFEMPKKDGLELIAAVRAEPSTGGLYAVMLTAHDRPALKINALTLGYDDFLPKGCTEVEVVAKVAAARRMLARQRAHDADAREWRDIANQDELTKVATRRFFFEQAGRHIAGPGNASIVLIDIDDFKAINDTHGHLTGDRVLKDIGALFLRRTRTDDVIARYGGDEFVLLVLNLGVDEIRRVAERLTAELSELQWNVADTTLRISVTMGIGCSALIDAPTVERLLDVADHELYARKWLKKHPSNTAPEVYQYPAAADRSLVSEIRTESAAAPNPSLDRKRPHRDPEPHRPRR
jgi:two-component system cell cycle response regulator